MAKPLKTIETLEYKSTLNNEDTQITGRYFQANDRNG
jgi:hypothetical protein